MSLIPPIKNEKTPKESQWLGGIGAGIELIVIPVGCNPYLQAGNIAVFQELKAKLGDIINAWKESGEVNYTAGGESKKPS